MKTLIFAILMICCSMAFANGGASGTGGGSGDASKLDLILTQEYDKCKKQPSENERQQCLAHIQEALMAANLRASRAE